MMHRREEGKRKRHAKAGIVAGMIFLALSLAGIVAIATVGTSGTGEQAPAPPAKLPDVATVNRNPAYEDTIVEPLAIELSLDKAGEHINSTGWNEYTIWVTNPNDIDVIRDIHLNYTEFSWNDTAGSWTEGAEKNAITLSNITIHPGDTVQFTVPVKLTATGEKSFYLFRVTTR